jgi:phage nucleotide-binding protein
MNTVNMMEVTKEEKPLHVVIYGEAGCGKTDLAAHFPTPMIVFDMDNKYQPMIGRPGIEISQYLMSKPEDAKTAIPRIWQDWQAVKKDPKWKTVVFDSVTALDRMLERYTVIMCGKNKSPNDRATIQEYGDMGRWYKTFFPSLRDAPDKNIIVLAHEQTKEDDNNKPLSIRPYITGKMGDVLPSIFEHTFHLEYKGGTNERWELRYRKQGLYQAASSIFSGGSGLITYGRGENGYEKIMEVMREETK